MTNSEIKQKIADLKDALLDDTDEGNIAMYKKGIEKYEAMLTETKDEPKATSKKSKVKTKAKTKRSKPQPKPKKEVKVKIEPKKVKIKAKIKPEPAVSKDEPKGASPVKKKLVIKKDKKEETHEIQTAFGKDMKDAILVLNKERFKIREIKDRKTGKTEQVKHTIEYKNAKTIQNRVNSIFDSAVYDIARTPKDKKEKKDIIEIVNDIRDLHSLWLNEIDIIIANEEQKDLEHIRKLMLSLMKEARKNDVDNKWRNAGGLEEMAKKFSL
jgi:hypothetical protein